MHVHAIPGSSVVKKKTLPSNAVDMNSISDDEDTWRTKWQPTPVFLPGKSHGQRSLAGYSSWGHKELDKT